MQDWREQLGYDPIPSLLAPNNKALNYFVEKDLLDKKVAPIESLWNIPEPQKILRKQKPDGSWEYPAPKEARSKEDYNQLETFRQLGFLVELYGFNIKSDFITKAAEYLFRFQTEEGDFRGIYGTQYTPNYSAGILELLIKAGYEQDSRIIKGLNWLLSVRQDDGGWVIPFRTHKAKWLEYTYSKVVLQPIRSKPFSYMVTGVVLRGFAAHPKYRKRSEVKSAAELLLSKFFKRDNYVDRSDASFWTKFAFPFWFTDLLSSLDSLYFLGFAKEHPQIATALEWFKQKQKANGEWDLKLLKGGPIKDYRHWIDYVVCRTFKRYFS